MITALFPRLQLTWIPLPVAGLDFQPQPGRPANSHITLSISYITSAPIASTHYQMLHTCQINLFLMLWHMQRHAETMFGLKHIIIHRRRISGRRQCKNNYLFSTISFKLGGTGIRCCARRIYIVYKQYTFAIQSTAFGR